MSKKKPKDKTESPKKEIGWAPPSRIVSDDAAYENILEELIKAQIREQRLDDREMFDRALQSMAEKFGDTDLSEKGMGAPPTNRRLGIISAVLGLGYGDYLKLQRAAGEVRPNAPNTSFLSDEDDNLDLKGLQSEANLILSQLRQERQKQQAPEIQQPATPVDPQQAAIEATKARIAARLAAEAANPQLRIERERRAARLEKETEKERKREEAEIRAEQQRSEAAAKKAALLLKSQEEQVKRHLLNKQETEEKERERLRKQQEKERMEQAKAIMRPKATPPKAAGKTAPKAESKPPVTPVPVPTPDVSVFQNPPAKNPEPLPPATSEPSAKPARQSQKKRAMPGRGSARSLQPTSEPAPQKPQEITPPRVTSHPAILPSSSNLYPPPSYAARPAESTAALRLPGNRRGKELFDFCMMEQIRVPQLLTRLRTQNKESAAEQAAAIGISENDLERIITSNLHPVPLKTLDKLVDYLGADSEQEKCQWRQFIQFIPLQNNQQKLHDDTLNATFPTNDPKYRKFLEKGIIKRLLNNIAEVHGLTGHEQLADDIIQSAGLSDAQAKSLHKELAHMASLSDLTIEEMIGRDYEVALSGKTASLIAAYAFPDNDDVQERCKALLSCAPRAEEASAPGHAGKVTQRRQNSRNNEIS